MKRLITAVIMLTAILLSTLGADRQKVGLVLSGGGAKGIAHIGVIQALEENGIPIDYITGTSMGAIVGSLYAAGYSPDEMLELLGSKGFAYWSTGKIDPDYTYFFMKNAETPSFVTINLGKDSTQITSVLPMSLVNPLPMNYAFIELYSPYSIQCGQDFDKLFVPFRCVTSDVYTKHKVVMRDGPLGDAVRMSMSFPMIFEPIELDGVPMYDGGIYDNYPVDVMMDDFAPDALIGVNVGSKDAPPSSRNMLDQLEEMIMQPNDYPFPYDKGVNIRIDLDEFGLLDFPKYREIYEIGYRRGLEMIDSVKMKVHARTAPAEVAARRDGFKALTPTVAIDSIHVSGGTPTENAYLTSLFKRNNRNAPLSLVEARDAYYRAVSTNKLQNFVPTPVYHSTDSTFGLDFKAVVKDNFNVGVGGLHLLLHQQYALPQRRVQQSQLQVNQRQAQRLAGPELPGSRRGFQTPAAHAPTIGPGDACGDIEADLPRDRETFLRGARTRLHQTVRNFHQGLLLGRSIPAHQNRFRCRIRTSHRPLPCQHKVVARRGRLRQGHF